MSMCLRLLFHLHPAGPDSGSSKYVCPLGALMNDVLVVQLGDLFTSQHQAIKIYVEDADLGILETGDFQIVVLLLMRLQRAL